MNEWADKKELDKEIGTWRNVFDKSINYTRYVPNIGNKNLFEISNR